MRNRQEAGQARRSEVGANLRVDRLRSDIEEREQLANHRGDEDPLLLGLCLLRPFPGRRGLVHRIKSLFKYVDQVLTVHRVRGAQRNQCRYKLESCHLPVDLGLMNFFAQISGPIAA